MMRTPDETRDLVRHYVDRMCNSDIDAIIELFADDATAEDPVGGDVQRGIDAVRAFYATNAPLLQVEITGPICVAANTCAFPLTAELNTGDSKLYLDAVDVMSFDDQGKINSMKAFWNPEEFRPQR